MSKNRHPDLAYWGNGIISIRNQDELDLLLACRAPIFDRESIQFVGLEWNDDEERLVAREEFVPGAAQQVVSAGILPEPTSQLPAIGARVETIEVGGKPSPACRYGVGTVTGSSWDCVFGVWRVEVTFDGCTGGWQGFPVYGTSTFVWMVHVIGSDERSFSDMTPGEIEALYQARRQQLHAPDRPATWLADSSDLADEAPDFVSERDKALAFFQGAPIHIWGQDELDCLLACPPSIAVLEDVSFTGRLDAKDRDLEGPWVANAIAQVVAAGILPAPTGGLPEFGSRVETICLANRQEPRYGHAVGKVGWLTWREGTWQVEVSFDRPVEMRRGGRLSSAASIPSMVHVIGSSGQPFSEMTPEQVKELHEARNQAL